MFVSIRLSNKLLLKAAGNFPNQYFACCVTATFRTLLHPSRKAFPGGKPTKVSRDSGKSGMCRRTLRTLFQRSRRYRRAVSSPVEFPRLYFPPLFLTSPTSILRRSTSFSFTFERQTKFSIPMLTVNF